MHLTTLKERREIGDLAKRNLLERYKKIQFSLQRSIDSCNGLKEEVIMANNLHQLKEKLDKYRHGNWITRV